MCKAQRLSAAPFKTKRSKRSFKFCHSHGTRQAWCSILLWALSKASYHPQTRYIPLRRVYYTIQICLNRHTTFQPKMAPKPPIHAPNSPSNFFCPWTRSKRNKTHAMLTTRTDIDIDAAQKQVSHVLFSIACMCTAAPCTIVPVATPLKQTDIISETHPTKQKPSSCQHMQRELSHERCAHCKATQCRSKDHTSCPHELQRCTAAKANIIQMLFLDRKLRKGAAAGSWHASVLHIPAPHVHILRHCWVWTHSCRAQPVLFASRIKSGTSIVTHSGGIGPHWCKARKREVTSL